MGIKLHISDALSLPLNAVTQKLAMLGRTGSGKSYAATKLAEQMHDAGAQIVALDPVGMWWGLRLAGNGRDAGIAIPVFGGLHGDVPLESGAGALMADLIVDRGISAICDVSQFEHDADKIRFATAFAARFFFRKKSAPSAVHVFIEEAQEFLPESPRKDEGTMLHHFRRMWKLGRNFGIGGTIISQRPQAVSKEALNLTECVFAFQLTGPHERKALRLWIDEKGLKEDLDAILPKLAVGEARVWSPAWLKISETIKVAAKRTFNASSTPEVGASAKVRNLAPIDLERIRVDMAATIEKQRAEDPRELRKKVAEREKQIAELQKQLAAGGKEKPADPAARERRKAELVEAEKRGYERGEKDTERAWRPLARAVATACRMLQVNVPIEPEPAVQPSAQSWQDRGEIERQARGDPPGVPARVQLPVPVRREPAAAPSNGLGAGERQVLIAIAQYPDGADRELIGILTGYKRSTRDAYIQRLVARGYVGQLGSGLIQAGEEGIAILGSDFEPLPTGDALREWWLRRLPEGERKVLEAIIRGWTNREQISENTGYKRSTRDAYIQRLATRKLVRPGPGGDVTVSGALFD